MQRVLVIQSCTTKPLYEISLEIIQKNIDAGNSVSVLACFGKLPTCLYSSAKNKESCRNCKYRQKHGLKLLSQKINVIRISNNFNANNSTTLPTELTKLLEYREDNIAIGKAIAAFYTCSHFSSYENELDSYFIRKVYQQYKILFSEFLKIADDYDVIYVHNGRFPIDKAIINYCNQNNKTVYCYDTADVASRYVMPKNVPIHDIAYIKEQMEELWNNAGDEKYQIGKDFFEKRRNHIQYGSYSFTKNQIQGTLPDGLDTDKEIITIFNSTAEEVFTVEGFEYKLFNDELDILDTICNHFKNDFSKLFVLRIHPHLKGCDNYQTQYLYKLSEKYSNLQIIKPEETVDTYALMDISSKIIVLNSTMGIESAYWDKPVILLGHAYYEDLKCSYIPESLEELWSLLEEKKLTSLKNDSILKYGYWDLNYGEIYKYCTTQSISEIYFRNKVIDKKSFSLKKRIKKIIPTFLYSFLKNKFKK